MNNNKHQTKVYMIIYVEEETNVVINVVFYHLVNYLLKITLLLC